jgi:hypothetical protein
MGGQSGPVKYVGLGFLIISIVGFIAALVALGSSLAIVFPELYESVVTLFSSISPRIVSSVYAEGNVIFPASTDS